MCIVSVTNFRLRIQTKTTMPKSPPADSYSNAAIVARLHGLLESHSQAEIARKTHTLRNNVSRYMRGAKIPLEFGAALVKGLGVNPAWLLVGEGAPMLSDVAATTVKAAEDMLELVEAMNAVSRMQLGSLTGKHHLKVLRELSDALTRHEKLRVELNARTAPIFKQILADYWNALQRWDFERADELSRAASQVARLSDDEKLAEEYDRTRAYHAYLTHDEQQAVSMQRRMFQRNLPKGALLDERSMRDAYNFATTLQGSSRMAEARRVCLAVLAMMPPEAERWPIARFITALLGFVETELGDIRAGLARVQAAFPQPDERMRPSQTSMLIHCLLYAGAISFEAACAMGPVSTAHSQGMLVRALCEDTRPALEMACQIFIGAGENSLPEGQLMSQFARAMLLVYSGQSREAVRQLLQGPLREARQKARNLTERFDMAVFAARSQRALGDLRSAQATLLEAERILGEAPPGVIVGLNGRALFYRNALESIDQDAKGPQGALRNSAREFFRFHFERGYGCFEGLSAV
ncbi:MAG: hypothetical protein HPKKFMNG_00682 [Planctomycetes bacterium]|nr:hypothetical protein [Planctomycetota bacterium]